VLDPFEGGKEKDNYPIQILFCIHTSSRKKRKGSGENLLFLSASDVEKGRGKSEFIIDHKKLTTKFSFPQILIEKEEREVSL